MQKLKVNDEVIILAGKDNGKKGKIKSINLKKRKALVEGVNVVKKAMKPSQENPSGGFAEVENPVDISNVAVVSPKTGKPTKVKIEVQDGKKVRVAKACGSVLK